jgi:hypothetical protein
MVCIVALGKAERKERLRRASAFPLAEALSFRSRRKRAADEALRPNREAAFWKDLQVQFAALMQTIPDIDGTDASRQAMRSEDAQWQPLPIAGDG